MKIMFMATSLKIQLRSVFFSSVGLGQAHISSLNSPCKELVKNISTWQIANIYRMGYFHIEGKILIFCPASENALCYLFVERQE